MRTTGDERSIILDVWKDGLFTWRAMWRYEDDPYLQSQYTREMVFDEGFNEVDSFTRWGAIRRAKGRIEDHDRTLARKMLKDAKEQLDRERVEVRIHPYA